MALDKTASVRWVLKCTQPPGSISHSRRWEAQPLYLLLWKNWFIQQNTAHYTRPRPASLPYIGCFFGSCATFPNPKSITAAAFSIWTEQTHSFCWTHMVSRDQQLGLPKGYMASDICNGLVFLDHPRYHPRTTTDRISFINWITT